MSAGFLKKIAALALFAMTTLVVGPASAASPSRAQREAEQKAQVVNDQGKQAFKDGRFAEAADLFMQVYDLVKTPTAVFNAARARQMAHKLPEAKALFELYVRMEKSPAGVDAGQAKIGEIDKQIKEEADELARQNAARAQAEADARAKAEADARRAREEALALAKKAEAERLELEKMKAEKARLDAQGTSPQPPTVLGGVALLPPSGAGTEEAVRTVGQVLQVSLQQAQAAQQGPVRSVADYVRAEMSRPQRNTCDFPCQLATARSLGAAWAVTTTLKQEAGRVLLIQGLWRTTDGYDAGQTEVAALSLTGLLPRAKVAAGDVFNPIRVFLPQPGPAGPPGATVITLETDPAGVQVSIDEQEQGVTPLSRTLRPGDHVLRLRKLGYHPRFGMIRWQGGTQVLRVTLPRQLPADKVESATAPPATPANGTVVPQAMPTGTEAASGAPSTAGNAPRTGEIKASKPSLTTHPASEGEDPAGVRWGILLRAEGGAALIEDAASSIKPDLAIGLGALAHVGYAGEAGPAWVSGVVGLRWQRYLGLSAAGQAASPHGNGLELGVLIPSANLMVTWARQWMRLDNSFPGFSYDTIQLRILQARSWFYFALGMEVLVGNDRPPLQLDEFGTGPNLRMNVEFGLNIPGTPMSK